MVERSKEMVEERDILFYKNLWDPGRCFYERMLYYFHEAVCTKLKRLHQVWGFFFLFRFFSSAYWSVCVWNLLSCIWLFATPWTIVRQAPLSMGIFHTRILEWVVVPSSKGSSYPGAEPRSPTLQVDSSPSEPPGLPKNTGMGSLSLLQGNFLTQESNLGLLHCRHILYQLSYLGRHRHL